jgi:7-carboxy-7-deazaguanine synthase
MKERIRVSEIFGPTVQGEGPLIGRPTVFVRTGGCDYHCTWCDTLYAVLPEFHDEWAFMTSADIMARVDELMGGNPLLVSLSGGNPALQPLASLIALGRRNGHSFALETQGSISQRWFAELDWLILSPKPPSAGMTMDWDAFETCLKAAKERPRCVLNSAIPSLSFLWTFSAQKACVRDQQATIIRRPRSYLRPTSPGRYNE